MIAFVTSFDEATRANFEIYQCLNLQNNVDLSADEATSARLFEELNSENQHLFIMSHGDDYIVLDQLRESAISRNRLLEDDLYGFNVFSFACNTSNGLGQEIAEVGTNWFGFVEPINPPERGREYQALYKTLFEFICTRFTGVTDIDGAMSYINDLKLECENITNDLDSIEGSSIAAYQSVKQMWEKQKIWLNTLPDDPIVHDEAPPQVFRW